MKRESMSTATPDMLPPARTRDAALGPAPARGQNLLAPVVSGLFGGPAREVGRPVPEPLPDESPDAIDQNLVMTSIDAGTFTVDEETGDLEIVAEEVTIELEGITEFELDEDVDEALPLDVGPPDFDLDETGEATVETAFGSIGDDTDERAAEPVVEWYDDDRSAPWERAEEPSNAAPADAVADDGSRGIWLAESDGDVDELVLETDEAVDVDAEGEPDMRQAPPPLSPWDLGAAATSGEAGERAERARAEWESLGQALSDSLIGASPPPEEPGPHGYELTDEKAAALDADGGSLFADPVISAGSSGTTETPVNELIRRLETFAASLREEGPGALARAQTGDDRFDALLASIAAGFLAGRGR